MVCFANEILFFQICGLAHTT